jgi:hypothetical protein
MIDPPEISMKADPRRASTMVDAGFSPLASSRGRRAVAARWYLRRPSSPTPTYKDKRPIMGRGILLWLLGVPIPIIILLALFWH